MRNVVLCDDCEIKKVSKLCKQNDFGIEVQAFYDPKLYEENPGILNDYKKRLKGVQFISMHAPFCDLCPGSSDAMIRAVTMKRFELAYKVALKLNIFHIIFHVGYVPGTGVLKNWAIRCVDFWNEFLEGKSEKMNYYLENMLEKTPEVLFEVISKLNRSNVKACLDIGHAHCYSKVPVSEWIETLKDKVGYVHMHDNSGEKDEHLGFGQGNIPLIEVFKLLSKYAPLAIWALECKTDSHLDSVNYLKANNIL